MNTRFPSWWIVDFHAGEDFILAAVISLLVSEMHVALGAILGIVSGKFAVELFLFFPLFFFLSFLFGLIQCFILPAKGNAAFIVVFLPYITQDLPALGFSSSPHPKDQLDCPPGPWCTLTLVLLL